ncbi:hypothetical protein ACWDZ4_05405 [Streptomyces sp. NPDC003016]
MAHGHPEAQVSAGTEAGLSTFTDIYHHYVCETAITFGTTVFTPEQRRP